MHTTEEHARTVVIERSGAKLHGWLAGSDSSRLVVMIHGATMDHRMFDAQLAPLVAAGYRILTVDLRGHGKSKPIGLSDLYVSDFADDVLAVVDEVSTERCILIGQSLGGYVVQDLLFRYPHRFIAAGVIGSTSTTMPISRVERFLLRSSLNWFRVWPYRHLQRAMVDSLAFDSDVRRYASGAMRALSKKEFLAVWQAVTRVHNAVPGYRIEHPLLLTHGDNDRTGNIAKVAPAWARRDPHVQYEVIPHARHNANQDNPRIFNQLLLGFLADYAPSSGDR